MFYLKKMIIINQLKFFFKMEQKKKEQKLWKKFKDNVSTLRIEIRKQKKILFKKSIMQAKMQFHDTSKFL